MTSSIFRHHRRLVRRPLRPSGMRALERWLAEEPPRADLIASYAVRSYTDRDGDPVLSIDVVPTSKALEGVANREEFFRYVRGFRRQAWMKSPDSINFVNFRGRSPQSRVLSLKAF
jgi:hypothetical protein